MKTRLQSDPCGLDCNRGFYISICHYKAVHPDTNLTLLHVKSVQSRQVFPKISIIPFVLYRQSIPAHKTAQSEKVQAGRFSFRSALQWNMQIACRT